MAESNPEKDEEFFAEAARAAQPSLVIGWIVLIVVLVGAYALGAALIRRGVAAARSVNIPNPTAGLPKIRLEELGQRAEEKVEAKAEALIEKAAETAAEKTVEKVKEEVKSSVEAGVKKTLGDKLRGN